MSGYLDHDGSILFAHRGGAALWPENTDRSFRGALELGYRYIETDLHMTRDGVIVCFHDDTVDRTTDGSGPVKERSLEELRALDPGHRFSPDGVTFPFRGEGCRVPTLEEAMAMHPDLRLNVEIKQRSPDVVGPLWRMIEERGWHDRLLVAAADDEVGAAFRHVCRGRVRTSAGIAGARRFWAESHLGLARLRTYPFDALQLPPVHGPLRVVTRRLLRAAHGQGIQVHVWTIDDPAEMRALLDLGVDGVMTDRPDLLVDVAGER